jgi:hypothetical protein
MDLSSLSFVSFSALSIAVSKIATFFTPFVDNNFAVAAPNLDKP